jgi:DNA-directed RNA polymerase specialized sigma24 family protein
MNITAKCADPAARLRLTEGSIRLQEAILTLTACEREVVQAMCEGLSLTQTAAKLQRPISTLQAQRDRAELKLTEALG